LNPDGFQFFLRAVRWSPLALPCTRCVVCRRRPCGRTAAFLARIFFHATAGVVLDVPLDVPQQNLEGFDLAVLYPRQRSCFGIVAGHVLSNIHPKAACAFSNGVVIELESVISSRRGVRCRAAQENGAVWQWAIVAGIRPGILFGCEGHRRCRKPFLRGSARKLFLVFCSSRRNSPR
jgi:hypothetical protein